MKTIRQILTCIMAGSVCYACHVEPNEKQPTVETAKKEFERAEKLVKDKIISDKQYELLRSQYEDALVNLTNSLVDKIKSLRV